MTKIIVHQEKILDKEEAIKLCPFDAIEVSSEGLVEINAGCKMCKICITKGPEGAFEYYEEPVPQIDRSLWNGITVYVEHHKGKISVLKSSDKGTVFRILLTRK